jgi:hypothetical protein
MGAQGHSNLYWKIGVGSKTLKKMTEWVSSSLFMMSVAATVSALGAVGLVVPKKGAGPEELVLHLQLITQAVKLGGFLGAVLSGFFQLWWMDTGNWVDAVVCGAFGCLFYAVICEMAKPVHDYDENDKTN